MNPCHIHGEALASAISSPVSGQSAPGAHEDGIADTRKSVSIIVPAYNAQHTIGVCLESLLRQTFRANEIIVVDDGSQDCTAQVAASYQVRVVKRTVNAGPGVARNDGAAIAIGEVLAFIDADCAAPTDWLEKHMNALQPSSVVAATGGYAGPLSDCDLPRLQHLVLRLRQSSLPPTIQSTITSNLVCLKNAFQRVGGFPIYFRKDGPEKPIWGNEDEELGFLLTRTGDVIRWMADIGVFHQFRPSFGGYLRQQRFYAERIILSHARFPQLAQTRSNYSRLSGALHLGSLLGVLLGIAALGATHLDLGVPAWPGQILTGLFLPIYLLLPVAQLWNLRRLGQTTWFLVKAYFVLLAVDLSWLAGALSGVYLSLGGFTNGNQQSSTAFAPADR